MKMLHSCLKKRFFGTAFAAFVTCSLCEGAQTARDVVIAVQQAMQRDDLAAAARLLADGLASNPNEGGLLNLRGVLHARNGEMAEARKDFSEATRLTPELTAAWQNLGRACAQLNDGGCAIEAWKRVLRAKPGDTEARASLAAIYEESGRFAESLAELAASGTDNLALRCLGLSGLGRIAEAKTAAARLAKQADFSEGELEGMHGPLDSSKGAPVLAMLVEELDKRNSAGLSSLRRLVMAYEHMGRTADARKILERVAKLDPGNTAHLLELARLAESSKDLEGSLGYLAHARDLDPGNAHIHFLYGSVADELNLPIEAKSSLDKALEIEPQNPNYNFAMGSVILKTRDAATAAAYFEKFVQKNPADARGHYALGLADFASGDYTKAAEQMRLAEADSGVAAPADYYLGRIARLQGDLEEAVGLLQKAIARAPALADPHTELGRIALTKGDLAGARAELERALRLAPDNFQANEQLLVLYRRTRDSRAEQQAEALKKLDEERSRRAQLMLRTVEIRR